MLRAGGLAAAIVASSIGVAGASDLAVSFDDNPAFAPDRSTPFYVSLGAGAIFPGDLVATARGDILGFPFKGSLDLRFETGFAANAVAGYEINDYLAVEGEFGYAHFEMKNIRARFSALDETVGATFGADGSVDSYMGFANLIVTPMGHGRVTPYIGGGIGAANLQSRLQSVSYAGLSVPLNESESRTDLALQAILGLDVAITERFRLGAEYTYLWIDTQETRKETIGCFCLFSATGKVNDLTASTVKLTGRLSF